MTERHPGEQISPLSEALPEILPGERIILRLLDLEDVAELHLLVLDNLDHLMILAFIAKEPMTLADRQILVAGWADDHRRGLGADMGIWLNDTLVGMVGIHRRGPDDASMEIGYWLDEQSEGLGFATEATQVLCEEAFAHPEVEVVRIRADLSNDRSRATAERAGFRWVGTEPTPTAQRSLTGTNVQSVFEIHRHEFDDQWRSRFV